MQYKFPGRSSLSACFGTFVPVFMLLSILTVLLSAPCFGLSLGAGKKDSDEEAPFTVPKTKLSKDQQKEFDQTVKNGDTYIAARNFELALICFMRATTLNPGSCAAHLGLAACYAGLNKIENAQIESFEALRCEPDNVDARFFVGQLMMRDARWDEAGGQFLQVLKQQPENNAARGNLATCLQMMGQIDAAIGQYRYILEKEPKNSQAAYNLAASYEMKNMYDEAAAYYKKVVELDTGNVNAYCSLAKCLMARKDFKAAQVLLDHAKKLNDKSYFVYLMQGYLFEVQGERRPAIEAYTRAIALNPQDADSKVSLQRLLESGGKVGSANGIKPLIGGKLTISR